MTAILLLTSALLLAMSAVGMMWIRLAAAAEQRHEWHAPVASGRRDRATQ